MTRTMADSIGPNSPFIPTTVDMVAGYDTGTLDVIWNDSDWARFPGKVQVHIDQGFGSTPEGEAHVLVFDVEKGAYSPNQAAVLIDANVTARPTIYVNRSNITATIASAITSPKWKGDIWLAFPDWNGDTAELPPIPSGCQIVAVQKDFLNLYDLSTVLDSSWPSLPVAANWTEKMMDNLPLVISGDDGISVRRVQGLLVGDGHDIAIDGIFGPATESAVKAIQTAAGIVVDGKVGPQTWPVLLGV
jgi:hypothetical protein